MRVLFIAAAIIASSLPAFAEASGPPADRFVTTWGAPPSAGFAPGIVAKIATVAPRQAAIPAGVLTDAFASASNDGFRRDLAIDEMATAWAPAQRAALEDLREAQRRWVDAVGGDVPARDARFAAMLNDVAEGRGRSVARDAGGIDGALGAAYADAMRHVPDEQLDALEASESAWITYRDAFARFAVAMDHPDAATAVRADLARGRTQELHDLAGRQ